MITEMEQVEELSEKLIALSTELLSIQKLVKSYAVDVKKLKKFVQVKEKRKRSGEPSGFNKPGPISEELLKFFGESPKTELARTDITKRISLYIKDNKLQNEENKREFIVDGKLSKLLKLEEGTSIAFFQIQKHMKHHYLPRTETTVVAPVVKEEPEPIEVKKVDPPATPAKKTKGKKK